jgi:hypothetical protein
MTPDDIDRILSTDELLDPSSGFALSVMEAVHQQMDLPPSPAFPWLRFAVGLIACVVVAASGTVLLLRVAPALDTLSVPLDFLRGAEPELGCVTAALLLSFALVALRKLRSTV